MKTIDGTTIKLTRGDSFTFGLQLQEEDGTPRYFEKGDKVIFTIKENFGDDTPLLRKIVDVTEDNTEIVYIELTKEDTTIDELISDKMTYQYDICLNFDETIIGYDDEGPKNIILYPEGSNDE